MGTTSKARPALAPLGWLFARIGNLTFGGGDPTMAALYREMVGRRAWLTPAKYSLVWTLARITPGTNLLAFCAGTGWTMAGIPGAVVAVFAVTLPSAALTVWLTYAYERFQQNGWAAGALAGVLAAAAGMMAAAAWQLVLPHLSRASWFRTLVLAGGAFGAAMAGVHPIIVLALGATAGVLWPGQRSSA